MGHSMARDNEEDKPSLDEMITERTELTQWSTIELGSSMFSQRHLVCSVWVRETEL